MPNDCVNHITITCFDPDELDRLIINELKYKKNETDDTYIYHEIVSMIQRGKKGIIFDIWSAWNPNYEWLDGLLVKYPNCWIKNEWIEEGGLAGVWIGYIKNDNPVIQRLEWNDICLEGRAFLFLEE